jgi:single-stranded DNA-binding protein
VNVVVLTGSIAADPVQRRMPSGDEVTERTGMAYCTSMGVPTKMKNRAPTMINPRKRLMMGWRE